MFSTPNEFTTRFPFPAQRQEFFTPEGQTAFARQFVAARDAAENSYYHEHDRTVTPRMRSSKFLRALIKPAINQPVKDAQEFYETFGRLMRWAWLSVSVGVYNEPIQTINDPALRLHTAQVNTIDIAWQAAFSQIDYADKNKLIVEVGTGRGNSVARLASLFPHARIVSITISPEQAHIAQQTVTNLGFNNVEIRRGDIFDPTITQDLIGQADAVAAIEVTGHFPDERKAEGIGRFAQLLKSGATLALLDTALNKPLPGFMRRYYSNQSWYFGTREGYLNALAQANVSPISYIDYGPSTLQTFSDTTRVLRKHRSSLQHEFGRLLSTVWPELPGTVYSRTMRNVAYLHIVGIKN